MTKSSVKRRKLNHLTLVWVREDCNSANAQDTPALRLSKEDAPYDTSAAPDGCPIETVTLPQSPGDPFDGIHFIDPYEPEQVEELRLYLNAIDDTEELSKAFLRRDWWWLSELHDEFRRACSGTGELSRLLARKAGFEFIVGLAESAAFRGDGPLSTPLEFTSEAPQEPKWNEEVLKLHELCRKDAVELAGCFSFMMH